MTRIPGIQPSALGVGGQDVAAFRDRNVRLITTLGSEFLDDLSSTLEGAASDLHVGDIADLIQERFNVSESRARFWARDQTLKLNAQLTEARATASGIDEYVWTTSADERVREIHAELEGQRFRYDDPPVTTADGQRNNPGEDYQCRCTAFPVLPEYSEEPAPEIDQAPEDSG